MFDKIEIEKNIKMEYFINQYIMKIIYNLFQI